MSFQIIFFIFYRFLFHPSAKFSCGRSLKNLIDEVTRDVGSDYYHVSLFYA